MNPIEGGYQFGGTLRPGKISGMYLLFSPKKARGVDLGDMNPSILSSVTVLNFL